MFRDAVLDHYDTVVFLSTTGDPLNATQQAAFERYIRAGGGYTGIHAAADTEYDVDLVRPAGGRLLPQPPARDARRDGPHRGHRPPLHDRAPEPLAADGRVVQLQVAGLRRSERPGRRLQPAEGDVHVLATLDEETYDEQDGSDGRTTIRSRGASATTAAARGTRAWATRRRRSARRTSASTSSAASRSRPAWCRMPTAACRTTSACRRSRIRPAGRPRSRSTSRRRGWIPTATS